MATHATAAAIINDISIYGLPSHKKIGFLLWLLEPYGDPIPPFGTFDQVMREYGHEPVQAHAPAPAPAPVHVQAPAPAAIPVQVHVHAHAPAPIPVQAHAPAPVPEEKTKVPKVPKVPNLGGICKATRSKKSDLTVFPTYCDRCNKYIGIEKKHSCINNHASKSHGRHEKHMP